MIDFDTRAFAQGLDRGVAQYEHDGEKALDKLGNHVASRARALVAVDTGEVQSHIGITAKGHDADGPFVDVGVKPTSDGHEIPLEYGTEFMAPQPFMRPALAEAPAQFGK